MAKYSSKTMGKETGSASVYAEPHTMMGKKVNGEEVMKTGTYAQDKAGNDVNLSDPVKNGVGYGNTKETKTSGIEMRGAGCATKGRMSRGPMA
jgi:hypothetical protein